MVRVIGRVDLADEVQGALAGAGIDAYVVTAGPTSAVESTGKDGSEADVVVQDVGMCGALKRKARHRPLVMTAPAKLERLVRANMRYASGPDALVVWPASGEELRAAIARAIAVAGVARPRLRRDLLPSMIVDAVGLVLLLAGMARSLLGGDTTLMTLGFGLTGIGWLLRPPYSLTRRQDLIMGALMLFLAATQLALHVLM